MTDLSKDLAALTLEKVRDTLLAKSRFQTRQTGARHYRQMADAITEAIAERGALRNERDNLKSLLRETLPYLPTELRGRVKGVVGC